MDIDWTYISQSWFWEHDATFEKSLDFSDWTWEEDRAFENAIFSVHPNDGEPWEKIALAIGKTTEEVKSHYEVLGGNVAVFEFGNVPPPHSPRTKKRKVCDHRNNLRSHRSSMSRGVTWTEEEHRNQHTRMPLHTTTGVCTSSTVVPTSSVLTPPVVSQPTQEHVCSSEVSAYPTPIASRQDCGVPSAGSSGVPSTYYPEYIDPDEFKNFPHFLD
ncbi:hypothetical protein ACS0TY_035892 [Phlomoides rotata]